MIEDPRETFHERRVAPAPLRPKRKGLYVLPNAISLAALFAAFYAIVMAMNSRFEAAALGIFASAVLDSLDGRVARMTHSQSAFGEHARPPSFGGLA